MSTLPKLIDPIQFAEKGKVLAGQLPLYLCSRVSELVSNRDGFVMVDLSFSKDGSMVTIQGHLEANLLLQCQHCLDSVNCSIACEVKLGIVSSLEAAERLSEDYEPLLFAPEDSLVTLSDIVEDELILAMPSYPKHADCGRPEIEKIQEDGSKPRADSPFGMLEILKQH